MLNSLTHQSLFIVGGFWYEAKLENLIPRSSNGHFFMHPANGRQNFLLPPPLPPTPPDFFAPHTPIISSVVCLSVLVLFLIYIFHAQMSETSAGKFRHKCMENNSNKFKNHFQYNTIQYNTIQYNTIQYNIQYRILILQNVWYCLVFVAVQVIW